MPEIQERLVLADLAYGNLPSFWEGKLPKAFNEVSLQAIQQFIDDCYAWINGSTISNAAGKNLDDIGFEYNVPRQGMNDDNYRSAILLKMASYSDSGTTTDIIRFVRSAYFAANVDITNYPGLAYGTMIVDGAFIDESRASNINQKVPSGSRVDIMWDIQGESFIPACLIDDITPDELLVHTDPSGVTDTLGVTLDGGATSTLGYIIEDSRIGYPQGPDRAQLSISKQGMVALLDSDGNPIELITDSGPVPLEIFLDSTIGGRYLASLPMTRA